MTKTRTDLIHRTLRNLGALPQGQSPSAEDETSIDEVIDSTLLGLQKRNVITLASSTTTFSDEYLLPLAHVMADAARSEYGSLGTADSQELAVYKERAERDLEDFQRGKTSV